IEILIPDVNDEVAHRRPDVSDEFIRNVPHLPKGTVDQFGAKIGSHEHDAVVDRVENGVKLLVNLRKRRTAARSGRPPTPAGRLAGRCRLPPRSLPHGVTTPYRAAELGAVYCLRLRSGGVGYGVARTDGSS